MLDGKTFLKIYDNLKTSITPGFKDYLIDMTKSQPLLITAMCLGYNVRRVEEEAFGVIALQKWRSNHLKDLSKQLIGSHKKKSTFNVEDLINFLDNHDNIGLSPQALALTLLSSKELLGYINLLVDDYVKSSLSELAGSIDQEEWHEVVWRNASIGYYYRIYENLMDEA